MDKANHLKDLGKPLIGGDFDHMISLPVEGTKIAQNEDHALAITICKILYRLSISVKYSKIRLK